MHSFMVLFGIFAFAAGASPGLFHNVRRIGWMITQGELDPLLAQPRPVLLRILCGRIHAPLMGDMLFGPAVFLLSGHAGVRTALLYVVVAVLAAVLMGSILLAANASAFWLRGNAELGRVAMWTTTLLASGWYG